MGHVSFVRWKAINLWLAARASKPRVRVAMRPTLILGVMIAEPERLIGPDGSVRHISRFECHERLQEAWCDFCDHHLGLLGFDTETMTLGPSPVSGKRLGHFPLTPPPTPALPASPTGACPGWADESAGSGMPDPCRGGGEFPAAAGFP
jgi:hypothetical protein